MEIGRRIGFDRVARFSVSKADPNKADMCSELLLITQFDRAPNHQWRLHHLRSGRIPLHLDR